MNAQSSSPDWRAKTLHYSPEAVVFAVLVFTAAKFHQLGVAFFLSFATLLGGIGLVGKMLLLWGGRKVSTEIMVSGCLAGGAFVGIATAEFGVIAQWWEPVFLLTLLLATALWWRARSAEEGETKVRHPGAA